MRPESAAHITSGATTTGPPTVPEVFHRASDHGTCPADHGTCPAGGERRSM
ncbi:hypothetical protein [Streptomyces sp. NPDC055005]